MFYLATFLLPLFITISLTPVLIRVAGRMRVLDMPDERKVHETPVPRIGGIAMAVGVFAAMLLWRVNSDFLKAYAIGAGIIVIFGIFDDLWSLDYKVKFAAQFSAALVVALYGGLRMTHFGALLPENTIIPSWVAVPLAVILIVGVTNAINLADGLDGLAGGICLISFCCIGYLAYLAENLTITLLSLALVAVIFGFLRFNTYPASLFMGDTGSQFLGFSLVTTSLWLTQGEPTVLSPVLPLIIFGFPVLDTATVMCERIAAGRSPFSADKNHFHHRLIRLGLYHYEAVLVIYMIQALLVVSAFLLRFHSDWLLLVSYGIFCNVVVAGFYLADRSGYRINRYDVIDRVVKGRLKVLKDRGLFIKVVFRIVEAGVPALLLVTCFLPKTIPQYMAVLSSALMVAILVAWFLKKSWMRWVNMAVLYSLIPFVVYFSAEGSRFSEGYPLVGLLHNLTFVLLVFFVVMTLKLTRRRRGFKGTPMDFLILFVAVAAPYIAGTYGQYKEFGAVAAKTIMFFFSFEVLIGELRTKFGRLTFGTLCTLLALAARGFLAA